MTLPTTQWRPLIAGACRYAPPVPEDVLEAMVMVESNGNPNARSASDARGLCQIIPRWHANGVGKTVAAQLGKPLTDTLWYDPEFSLRAGALHLRWCYTSDGSQSWERAVRKYHSGSADPPSGFVDGQGTSSDAHITKFRAALAAVRADRGQGATPEPPSEQEPVMALNFDPALTPFPHYRNRYALKKVDGAGQDNFGKRTFRGNAWHRGLTGGQTLDQAVDYLISPSTEGLTDGYIDNKTGELVMMNPMEVLFDDIPSWWEDRAGWANGVYGRGRAPSADALGFVARFGARIGANIINQDIESYEVLGNYDSPISEACKVTMVMIAANRAQILQIPYDQWPVNPKTDTVVHFGHCEFTLKDCPGSVVWAFINGEMVRRVREVLRIAQTSGKGIPAPKPEPTSAPPPAVAIEGEIDQGMATWFFGSVAGDDGAIYTFDPKGIVSNAWLERGEKIGQYPELVKVYTPDTRKIFQFSDGSVMVQATPGSGVEYI